MKRSKTVGMVFLSTVVATALSGCFEDENKNTTEGYYFKNEAECTDTFNVETCKKMMAEASEQHDKTAPRYDSRNDCETQYGTNNCQQRSSIGGGSYFIPFMAGYMISNYLNNGAKHLSSGNNINQSDCQRDRRNCGGSGSAYVRPYYNYSGNSGTVYGGAGAVNTTVGPASTVAMSKTAPPTSFVATPVSPSTSSGVSRGGFGGSGHSSGVSS